MKSLLEGLILAYAHGLHQGPTTGVEVAQRTALSLYFDQV
jgi:hypothetical protein